MHKLSINSMKILFDSLRQQFRISFFFLQLFAIRCVYRFNFEKSIKQMFTAVAAFNVVVGLCNVVSEETIICCEVNTHTHRPRIFHVVTDSYLFPFYFVFIHDSTQDHHGTNHEPYWLRQNILKEIQIIIARRRKRTKTEEREQEPERKRKVEGRDGGG